MKRLVALFFLVLLVLPSYSLEISPKWGKHGIVVNGTTGNSVQQNPKTLKIGNGYLVVFEDYRSGKGQIYLQKLDENGNCLFGNEGICLSKSDEDQNFPQIVASQNDSAIIVFQDRRNGNFDINAIKVNSRGEKIWETMVVNDPQDQVFPQAQADGQGGGLIVFQDLRNGPEDIYGQRIDLTGKILWQKNGIPICQKSGSQMYPKIAFDGSSLFVGWLDHEKGDNDVFAQKVSLDGKLLWAKEGVMVCGAPQNQEGQVLASDCRGGVFFAWQDLRLNRPGIYYQRVKADGTFAYAVDGIQASIDSIFADKPEIAMDGQSGILLAWSDPKMGTKDIYLQHISSDGALLFGENGLAMVTMYGDQENPKIYGSGPWIVSFEDNRNFYSQLYLQKVMFDGSFAYDEKGLLVSKKGKDCSASDILFDGNSAFLVFQDKRWGNFDIFSQKVDSAGQLLFGEDGLLVNASIGKVLKGQSRSLRLNDGSVLFVFEDYRYGNPNLYLQKVMPSGKLAYNKDGIPLCSHKFTQKNPEILAAGKNAAYLVWEDERDLQGAKIYIQKIDGKGKILWKKDGIGLTPDVASIQGKPKPVSDGKEGAVIVFTDLRNQINYQDIYAQRIDNHGKLLWGQKGALVSAGNGNQDDPVISPKNFVVAWTDYRMGEKVPDIYSQKLGLNGKALWEEDGIPVCEAPDAQLNPQIVDIEKDSMVVWMDKGSGSYDLYAQKIGPDGRNLWVKDGIPLVQAPAAQQNPKIALGDNNALLCAFEDYRFQNWDIFLQIMLPDGSLKYNNDGISVSNLLGTQYAPSLVYASSTAFVAWEDFRSGVAYDIYLQALDKDGSKLLEEEGALIAEGRNPLLLQGKIGEIFLTWDNKTSISAQKINYENY